MSIRIPEIFTLNLRNLATETNLWSTPDQQHHTVINVESALALAVQDTGDGEVKQQQYGAVEAAKKNGLQECGLGCPPLKRPPSQRVPRNV